MRSREEILADGKSRDALILEVLLDIRDSKKEPKHRGWPKGKPRKVNRKPTSTGLASKEE